MSHHFAQEEPQCRCLACTTERLPLAGVVIAIRDLEWGQTFGDALDNEDIYYEHHHGTPEHADPDDTSEDGFVRRGDHYVLITVKGQGKSSIETGYHRDEIPDHAFVMGD